MRQPLPVRAGGAEAAWGSRSRSRVAGRSPTTLLLCDQTSHLPGVLGAITATASGPTQSRRRRQPERLIPARARRQVSARVRSTTCSSPKVRISTPSTVRRCDRPHRLPSFAAIAGVAGVLAAGLIRDDLQAHLALARVGEQPPSSTPTSLPVRTTRGSAGRSCRILATQKRARWAARRRPLSIRRHYLSLSKESREGHDPLRRHPPA